MISKYLLLLGIISQFIIPCKFKGDKVLEKNKWDKIEIFFPKNKYTLSKENKNRLDTLASILVPAIKADMPKLKIELIPINCEVEIMRNKFIGVQRSKVIIDCFIKNTDFSYEIFSIKEPDGFHSDDCELVGVEICLNPF